MALTGAYSLHPQPLPGEWLGSWLFRLATINGVLIAKVFSDLSLDSTRLPSEQDMPRFSVIGACPPERVLEMLALPPLLIQDWGRVGGVAPVSLLSVRFCQVCPECLLSDPIPYIRSGWLDASLGACPVHHTGLLDACPHCEARIMPAGDRTRTSRRAQSSDPRLQNDLRRCWDCRGDLATRKAPVIPISNHGALLIPPAHLRRKVTPTPEQWLLLVKSLRRFISVFGLYRRFLPDTGTMHWERFPEYFPESHRRTSTHRFQTEHLLTQLCQGGQDDDRSLQSRLQWFAQFIVSLDAQRVARDNPTSDIHFRRLWIAQQLLHMASSPRDLLERWPVLAERLLDFEEGLLKDPRGPALLTPFLLTQDQQMVVAPLMKTMSDVHKQVSISKTQVIDASLLLSAGLWMLSTGQRRQDFKQTNYPDYRGVKHHLERWEDRGRLGVILGELHRHLQDHAKTQADESWWIQTRAVFDSDGLIELSRRVNPALHRALLNRFVQSIPLPKAGVGQVP